MDRDITSEYIYVGHITLNYVFFRNKNTASQSEKKSFDKPKPTTEEKEKKKTDKK